MHVLPEISEEFLLHTALGPEPNHGIVKCEAILLQKILAVYLSSNWSYNSTFYCEENCSQFPEGLHSNEIHKFWLGNPQIQIWICKFRIECANLDSEIQGFRFESTDFNEIRRYTVCFMNHEFLSSQICLFCLIYLIFCLISLDYLFCLILSKLK